MARVYDAEGSRKRILDAATELFLNKGYDNVTIQDIIRESGLSKGAVYYHFENKESVYEAMCDDLCRMPYDYLDELLADKSVSAREIMSKFENYLANYPQKVRLNTSIISNRNPYLFERIVHISIEECAPLYAMIIERGVAEGIYTVEDPLSAAELFCICSDVWMNPRFAGSNEQDVLKRRLKLFREILTGIGLPIMDENMQKNAMRWGMPPTKRKDTHKHDQIWSADIDYTDSDHS